MTERTRTLAISTVGIVVLLLAIGCGGGNGGSSGSSTISGNVSNAETSSLEPARASWFAWVRENLIGMARRAFAQGAGVDGIQVTAGNSGRAVSDDTDESGNFVLAGVPTGDVTLRMQRGNCDASESLSDVTAGSEITLEDVDFQCDAIQPAKIAETFRGVVRNKPSSPNGNLNTCVRSGGEDRTRVVKIQNATTFIGPDGEAATWEDIEEGDRIEAEGAREGFGTSSALDAETLTILDRGAPDDCEVGGTETPTPDGTATATPEATATPTATEAPTP